ncbi:pyruvate ferredoxin oxidoreductase [Candidatus Woesearchaeota archaeon]|nr:pyruvate ferredoxin oxidoreductase [Candidatus Woesearchaeota archaeon]
MNLKELSLKENRFVPGHRACAGCGFPQIINTVLKATGNVVASCATGCMEVTSTVYPHTAWKVPWIHSLFENAAATISGVETAYNVLKRKGKVKKDIKFVAFGGDGGTYDIGLQSLSGAAERGHKFVYVLYDNEAYMNTGVQRSSGTPFGAATTTSPDGKIHHGKEQFKKDIAKIMAAHNIPYVAQTTVAHWNDLYTKAEKAFNADGPAFLNVLQPCTLGWKFPGNMAIEIAKLAAESRFWPLYEVENGVYKLNYDPAKPIPVSDYLKTQGRFAHLFKQENKEILEKIQKNVDEEWEKLLKLCRK